jgi:hypothetical protein
MTDTSSEIGRLASAVAGLLDGPPRRNRPPTWRAWTPGGMLLLFESEHEQVARLLVVLLASQLGARLIVLESPDGAESCYQDGRWQAIPDTERHAHDLGHLRCRTSPRLRLVSAAPTPAEDDLGRGCLSRHPQ